jgi:putative membrane protein
VWVGCDEDDDNSLNKPDLNETDETFVEVAARSNMAEIEFGELAASKASDSLVKSFAQQMVSEHTAAQNELKDLADDFGGIEWPNDLDQGHDSVMAELNNASGYTFDTLYMKSQVMAHQNAVNIFATAKSNSTDTRVKAYATKYHPHIEMHLEKADSIQTVVRTNGAIGRIR